jgi:hypothetical protein
MEHMMYLFIIEGNGWPGMLPFIGVRAKSEEEALDIAAKFNPEYFSPPRLTDSRAKVSLNPCDSSDPGFVEFYWETHL